jgi:transcriptional regulator with XRE-family HTH domain
MRAHRLLTGLSQDNFADAIDMHRAYYSAIERGEKNITLVTLHRVAAGLGVTMAELLRDVDG